jgi:hypothetical protein
VAAQHEPAARRGQERHPFGELTPRHGLLAKIDEISKIFWETKQG